MYIEMQFPALYIPKDTKNNPMANDNHISIVYVLSNRVMSGLVKIGMTTRPELDARLKDLYSTGVPVPFDVEYACEVKAADCCKIEKALHTAFDLQRINVCRESFQIKKEQAVAIFELFNQKDVKCLIAATKKDYRPTNATLSSARKRIETVYSQLDDQFLLVRNYAKQMMSIFVRITAKISALNIIQYLNFINNKPIGRVKTALF